MNATIERVVLVVEDDRDIAALVNLHLSEAGYAVHVVHDGDRGLAAARRNTYDLVILDLMLPGLDGLSVAKELRRDPRYVPILMLTSKSSEIDRVLGLEIGADDYLTKPFSIRELVARVRAQLRRADASDQTQIADYAPVLVAGNLRIDTEQREVLLGGGEIELTAREFDLLTYFARHPGRVFTRAQLLDQVWGYGHEGYEHTVNSHINRLRSKIEQDPTKPQYVLTVWGVGYKFRSAERARGEIAH